MDSTLLQPQAQPLGERLQFHVPAGWQAAPQATVDSLNANRSPEQPFVIGLWGDSLLQNGLYAYQLDSTLTPNAPGERLDSTQFAVNQVVVQQQVYQISNRLLYRIQPLETDFVLDYTIYRAESEESIAVLKLESSLGTLSQSL